MKNRSKYQAGFGAIFVVVLIVVISITAGAGYLVVQHDSKKPSTNTAHTTPIPTPVVKSKPPAPTPPPEQKPTQYLVFKEWGLQMPLSDDINDLYYSANVSSTREGDVPNTARLGLTSLDESGCESSNNGTPIGALLRTLPSDREPVIGKTYPVVYPGGITIDGYYYTYAEGRPGRCVSPSTLEKVIPAIHKAVKKMSKVTDN